LFDEFSFLQVLSSLRAGNFIIFLIFRKNFVAIFPSIEGNIFVEV
jgi:hypothetical protein